MKHSITKKITTIMISIVAGTILLCWFINTTLLEEYYISNKENSLVSTFRDVDAAYSNGTGNSEEFAIDLEKKCANSNITLMVIHSDGTIIQSNVSNKEVLREQFFDIMFSAGNHDAVIVKNTGKYMIQKATDTRLNSDYLVLWGNLKNGDQILLRTALDGIKESAAIANRFLAYVGGLALIICGVILYLVTKKITTPILRLSEISKRMTKLDFDAKFQSSGDDEIALLGEHMNQLSETLELTISELKSANNELKSDIEKKNQIDEMRKDFISNVSHELKTPIALIQGYAEGLKECINDDAESREFYCEVIMDEAEKMNRMVKNLLTLNQLESGNEHVVFERFDLTELIRGVSSASAILLEQQGINLIFHEEKPMYVWADEFKTEQVLTNYISNAIHYAAGEKRIEITMKNIDGIVRVGIFNTGKPIPESEIAHVWDKFYKVDKARTREYGGHGIGLSIVKAIMDSFHRECGVINYADGVEFWFELDAKNG